MPTDSHDEKYSPLALIATLLVALLLFAVFFVGFLVAPLAILVIFYVGFAASDRSKRASGSNAPPVAEPAPAALEEESADERLAREALDRRAHAEQAEREAQEAEAAARSRAATNPEWRA